MAIPVGVILIWDGLNSAIPSGWTRETLLDGKFPKAWGASIAPNVSGGSNTHSHSSNAHGHTMTAHHHTYVTGLSNEWTAGDYSGSSADGGENNMCAKHDHQSATNTTTSVSGGSLQSQTVTWTSVDHQPPYLKVIFIKPNGAPAPLMNGICAHLSSATVPVGFSICNGAGGTLDLRNKYLKGADAGGDAGATGGATSHQHTVTHGHTANAHSHSGNTQNNTNPHGARQSSGLNSTGEAGYVHQHAVTLDNATDTVANFVKTDAGATDTVEPAYKKVHVVKNTLGGVNERAGLIGLWLGDTANIPVNWALCDGNNGTLDLRDKYIKVALDSSELGGIGGSNTHSHSAISHTHSSNGGHSHTGSTGGSLTNWNRRGANQGAGIVRYYDTHAISSVSTVTPTYSSDSMDSGNAVSNEPAYLTVAYIQLLRVLDGGCAMFSGV